jgi:hypothetical protein
MKSGEEILDFSARHELRGSVVNICFLSDGALCEPSSQDVRSPEIKEVVHHTLSGLPCCFDRM